MLQSLYHTPLSADGRDFFFSMKPHHARINWKRLYTPLVQHNGDVSRIPQYRFQLPDVRPDPELALAMATIAFSHTTMVAGRPRYALCDTQLRSLALKELGRGK